MNQPVSTSPWPFVLPLLVFLAFGLLEPQFARSDGKDVASGGETNVSASERRANEAYVQARRQSSMTRYCVVYGLKVLAVCTFLGVFAREYLRHFPFAITRWSVITGVAGIVLWVGFCHLNPQGIVAGWLNADSPGARSQFNPFEEITLAWQLATFLAVRFFGLVVVVPVCEELFLRGFLMRYVQSTEWWRVSLVQPAWRAALVAPLYGAVTHPGEILAAVTWFSLVTWLVARTGKFWDAVVAHAVTNLLLGLYVCLFSQWQLW